MENRDQTLLAHTMLEWDERMRAWAVMGERGGRPQLEEHGYRSVLSVGQRLIELEFRKVKSRVVCKSERSSSMLLLGCLGDLLRFEKREIQVATFAPDRSSP